MNEKRYQVFISSTFKDLSEERKSIMEAIVTLDCFPSGMEMFPASDFEQFEYIKSIIDESDYYILIVAGKYGSTSDSGISYTEMEYDYAKEKEIPILTFLKRDINSLTGDKIELDQNKRKKLNKFREKISKNKMIKYWDESTELKYIVHSSLTNAIKIHKRIGWIRGNVVTDKTLLKQINELRLENESLKHKITNLEQNEYGGPINSSDNLAQGNNEYEIYYNLICYKSDGNEYEENNAIKITWNNLFHLLGYELLRVGNKRLIMQTTEDILENVILTEVLARDGKILNIPKIYEEDTTINVEQKDIVTILIQLTYLKLIFKSGGGDYLLTDMGKNIIEDSILIKSDTL